MDVSEKLFEDPAIRLGVARSKQKSVTSNLRFHLFKGEQFNFQFIRGLAYASDDGAAIGECLDAASQIKEQDTDSWVKAWSELGARVEASGQLALDQRHPTSARKAFLRAYNYYRAAEFFASLSSGKARALYQKSVSCFARAGALADPDFEPVRLPYDSTTLPRRNVGFALSL